ncbi:hypothetical protein JCM3765_004833 [Sporobolomyces pararoseus]
MSHQRAIPPPVAGYRPLHPLAHTVSGNSTPTVGEWSGPLPQGYEGICTMLRSILHSWQPNDRITEQGWKPAEWYSDMVQILTPSLWDTLCNLRRGSTSTRKAVQSVLQEGLHSSPDIFDPNFPTIERCIEYGLELPLGLSIQFKARSWLRRITVSAVGYILSFWDLLLTLNLSFKRNQMGMIRRLTDRNEKKLADHKTLRRAYSLQTLAPVRAKALETLANVESEKEDEDERFSKWFSAIEKFVLEEHESDTIPSVFRVIALLYACRDMAKWAKRLERGLLVRGYLPTVADFKEFCRIKTFEEAQGVPIPSGIDHLSGPPSSMSRTTHQVDDPHFKRPALPLRRIATDPPADFRPSSPSSVASSPSSFLSSPYRSTFGSPELPHANPFFPVRRDSSTSGITSRSSFSSASPTFSRNSGPVRSHRRPNSSVVSPYPSLPPSHRPFRQRTGSSSSTASSVPDQDPNPFVRYNPLAPPPQPLLEDPSFPGGTQAAPSQALKAQANAVLERFIDVYGAAISEDANLQALCAIVGNPSLTETDAQYVSKYCERLVKADSLDFPLTMELPQNLDEVMDCAKHKKLAYRPLQFNFSDPRHFE